MCRFFVILIIVVSGCVLPGQVFAAQDSAGPVLLSVTKSDGLISSQLILNFTRLPEYALKTSGQRIDLNLKGVTTSSSLKMVAPDSTIVDTLLARKPSELVVSFLMRRPPIKATVIEQKQQDQLILELKWARQSKARPAIAYKIDGTLQVDPQTGAMRRKPSSDYSGRWLLFFSEYQAPFTLKAPIKLTLPSLPLSDELNFKDEPVELSRAYADGDWAGLVTQLIEAETPGTSQGVGRELLLAEALVRTGKLPEALKRLRAHIDGEAPTAYVRYLTGWALAQNGQRFDALVHLAPMKRMGDLSSDWLERLDLLEAEISLANSSLPRALKTLEADRLWSPALQASRDLRLLDTRALRAKLMGAGDAYAPWLDGLLIYQHPYSLGQAAAGLFRKRDYARAKELLSYLSKRVSEPESLAMIQYAEALATDALDPVASVEGTLHTIRLRVPESEAGYRSWLLLTDRQVVDQQGQEPLGAMDAYEKIAAQALHRGVREEAAFKRALLLFLNDRLPECIDALTAFRRGYRRSPLGGEAAALLAEILPKRIQQLMDAGEDLQALVLVEKNRRLLLHSGLDMGFLHDLALSMNRLGLWDRAVRVYIYMLDASENNPEFETKLYLPLVQLLSQNDQFEQAEKYCAMYFDRYNEGDDRFRIYQLWIEARQAQENMQGMLYLLERPDRPSDPQLEALACEIFWSLNDYEAVQRLARRVKNLSVENLARVQFLQAESLYQLKRFRQANRVFAQLASHQKYRDQALYRRASIHWEWGQKQQTQTLLEQLLTDETDLRWKALAQDLLVDVSSN